MVLANFFLVVIAIIALIVVLGVCIYLIYYKQKDNFYDITIPMPSVSGRYVRIYAPMDNTVSPPTGQPINIAGVFIYAAILLTTHLRGSTFIGALPLAILMIPTVTRTAQEVLNLVPNELREAGLALGATQWRTVMTIVIPAARSGLITATILGIARIAGETAPLLFTLGTTDKVNWNPFVGGQNALPYYVWSGLRDGTEGGIQRAWSAILVLLILVIALFTTARIFGSRKAK